METTRLSVNIANDVAQIIREVQGEQGITATEFIRRSISTYWFIYKIVRSGGHIVVDEPGKPMREIILL